MRDKVFIFFQAEDGIRDLTVTGVQTCALPICGTEPRLTNTTIDGINVPSPEGGVRQIKFDAIPADIVESVEINKTLQANMDGDGIGGSVNLVTKTAGERPKIGRAHV